MPIEVADRSANRIENIEHAVEVLGKSKVRREVFRAVYTGRSQKKSVDEITAATLRPRQSVLDAGKRLVDKGIVKQTTKGGVTAYEKIRFFQAYRDEILRYADKPDVLAAQPTKRRQGLGRGAIVQVAVNIPRKRIKAQHITIDDINSFSKLKGVKYVGPLIRMKEKKFKEGLKRVIDEKGSFNDWGGELSDLYSTRFSVDGTRRPTAIALKGSGTSGKLTPKKMGKNGDQIQRLLLCPAEVFLIQYCGEVELSVYEQLESLARLKSFYEERVIYYGVIDGQDSSRLVKAYKTEFEWGTN